MRKKFRSRIKSIPFRVFIMVLTAGIIGIAGVLILKHNINKLSQNYQEIIEEHNENRICMEQFSQLLYQHRSFIAIHVASREEKYYTTYEEKEREVRKKMGSILLDLRGRMTGDNREQIYHKVYSDYYSYVQSVDVTLELSREGNTETAIFYLTGQMRDFVQSVNANLAELEQLTTREMDLAKEKMESRIDFSHMSVTVCIIMISATMLICLIYCVTITLSLIHI